MGRGQSSAPYRGFPMVSLRTATLALAALFGAGCLFHPDPEVDRFGCSSDADCGDGYACVPQRSLENQGKSFCFKSSEISPEVCNSGDDDKDGVVDNLKDPPCDSGLLGLCAMGSYACVAGARTCAGPTPTDEICNGLDDNCDGVVDDGFATPCK